MQVAPAGGRLSGAPGLSEARASAFGAALARIAPPSTPSPSAPSGTLSEPAGISAAPSPTAKGWTKLAAPRLATLFFAGTGALIEATGRRPNEVEPETETDVAEAMALNLAVWFPNAELSPFKQLVIACGAAAGEMWIGAEKIKPEAKLKPAPVPTAAPRTSAPPIPTTPPPPPAPAPTADGAPAVVTSEIAGAFDSGPAFGNGDA